MEYKFECDNGKIYISDKKLCLFCSHCTDIAYDFQNGPYMLNCEHKFRDVLEWNELERCKHFKYRDGSTKMKYRFMRKNTFRWIVKSMISKLKD